ncbi:hypothetical protein DWV75_02490 [Ruminococcus sp. AF12-5]|nr:hypothetical protein DWV75_02490 [Ruminococcus sp. AF12-5]
MEKYDVVLNTKGLRKAAFAVGFGLCMGKAVAKAVDMFVCAAVGVVLDHTVDKLSDDDEPKKKSGRYEWGEPENSKEEE